MRRLREKDARLEELSISFDFLGYALALIFLALPFTVIFIFKAVRGKAKLSEAKEGIKEFLLIPVIVFRFLLSIFRVVLFGIKLLIVKILPKDFEP